MFNCCFPKTAPKRKSSNSNLTAPIDARTSKHLAEIAAIKANQPRTTNEGLSVILEERMSAIFREESGNFNDYDRSRKSSIIATANANRTSATALKLDDNNHDYDTFNDTISEECYLDIPDLDVTCSEEDASIDHSKDNNKDDNTNDNNSDNDNLKVVSAINKEIITASEISVKQNQNYVADFIRLILSLLVLQWFVNKNTKIQTQTQTSANGKKRIENEVH